MPENLLVRVDGISELTRKVNLMKQAFDGAPLAKVLRAAGRPIAKQAQRNARVGPTGRTKGGVVVLGGRKASKFGALIVVKAKWKGTGAIFEEGGTGERIFNVMKIPLSKLGAVAGKLKGGGKGAKVGGGYSRRPGTFTPFGFLYSRKAKAVPAAHFFSNAVTEKLPQSAQIIEQGCRDLLDGAIK